MGGGSPSEERAATSNSFWGPANPEFAGVAVNDGRGFNSRRLHQVFSALADGNYGEVEVSAATMGVVRDRIQGILVALSWSGPRRHYPS